MRSQHMPVLRAVQLHAVSLCKDYLQAERHPLQQEISGKLAFKVLMATFHKPLHPQSPSG